MSFISINNGWRTKRERGGVPRVSSRETVARTPDLKQQVYLTLYEYIPQQVSPPGLDPSRGSISITPHAAQVSTFVQVQLVRFEGGP